MAGLRRTALALAGLAALLASPAHAVQICGWMTETVDADGVHNFDLWLQSDGRVEFLYRMSGKGVVTDSGYAFSPGSGSYSLDGGKPEKPWGFGSSVDAPADIDMVAEIHVKPVSIFDEDAAPLLASFTFRRHIPEGEAKPPAMPFGDKQCATVPAGH